MKRTLSVMLTLVVVSGCQVATEESPIATGTRSVPQSTANEVENSLSFQRLRALSDVDAAVAFGAAGNIGNRCDRLALNEVAARLIAPAVRRGLVFKKKKVEAAYDIYKADFKAKYGKELESNSNHCDVAKRELKERTAVSAFFLDNDL